MKILDENGLLYLWQKIKAVISKTTGIPVNGVIDYEGDTIPEGYEEVENENDYSTEEQVIGTWIDGKPLYRKTFNIGTLPNNTEMAITLPINCKRVIKFYGYSTDGSYGLELPSISLEAPILIFISYVDNSAILRTHSDRSNNTENYLTLEYTKTTD